MTWVLKEDCLFYDNAENKRSGDAFFNDNIIVLAHVFDQKNRQNVIGKIMFLVDKTPQRTTTIILEHGKKVTVPSEQLVLCCESENDDNVGLVLAEELKANFHHCFVVDSIIDVEKGLYGTEKIVTVLHDSVEREMISVETNVPSARLVCNNIVI